MDLLRAEIDRKRKATEELRRSNDGGGVINTTKFMRQGDILAMREKEREEVQRKLNEERLQARIALDESASTKAPIEKSEESVLPSVPSSSVLPSAVETKTSMSTIFASLSIDEVKKRLREVGQPITLFGESQSDRINRLICAIKIVEDAVTESDRKDEDDTLRQSGDDDDDDDDDDEDEKDENSDRKGGKKIKFESRSGEVQSGNFSEMPHLTKEKVVYKYFRSLQKQWEWDLSAREDTEKSTSKGKMETKTQKQCKDHIRPLFKLCKKKAVPQDILEKLFEMVKSCEAGNFRVAHDHYYLAAIGNAAWPIGLTMVGIHERSGRERINTGKVAHVMNNELQRKYFTSVKRLMTYAQTKRPDVAPSMKVL